MKNVMVRKSDKGWHGVFTTRTYKQGEVVVPWEAEKIINKSELISLTHQEKEYVSKKDDGNYILFAEPGPYVNHSCDPNTKAEHIANVAIRDIKKGEEITTDYELEGALNQFQCNCGSKNCRGFIGKRTA